MALGLASANYPDDEDSTCENNGLLTGEGSIPAIAHPEAYLDPSPRSFVDARTAISACLRRTTSIVCREEISDGERRFR